MLRAPRIFWGEFFATRRGGLGMGTRSVAAALPAGRLLFILLLAASAVVLALAPWVSAGSAASAVVKPMPFAAEHIDARALTFPPTTADCQRLFGINCYRPAQMRQAYNMQPLYSQGLTGAGRTIVIVDSFGSPTIEHDLHVFDQTFGLPDPPSLKIITPAGAPPPFDPHDSTMVGWAQETTLDVEWSHVIAPGANILLVATPVAETEGVQGFPEMMASENFVIDHNLGDVISQSFGATEETFPNKGAILNLRSAFKNARKHNVTVLASSGDTGVTNFFLDGSCCYPMRVNSWPSADPLVTSMGGTQLHLDAAGNRVAPDEVWNDGFGAAGGGVSAVFERPEFQDKVESVVGERRGTPDVSLSAAVDGGVVVYYTFTASVGGTPWHIFGGTSEASPLFAGVVAIADQAAGHRLGWLNPRLYRLRNAGLVDITKGNNSFIFCASACGTPQEVDTTVIGFNAVPGFDLASGLGTIDATRLVHALASDNGDDRNVDDRGDN